MGYQSWGGPPFGGVNMDFSGGSLTVSWQNRQMNFSETNGVICSNSGNLLFSSNGIWIANAQNDTMLNGSGLNPGFWTSTRDSDGLSLPQGNLVIPFPDDTSKYYLFHETIDDYGVTNSALYLYYSVIDMSLDSGRGAVTQKNTVLLSGHFIPGRLTACRHGNGRDWWLIAHEHNSNKYFKWLVTPGSILGPYVQNIGAIRDPHIGQCVFSTNGELFAYYEPVVGDLDIYLFDRCSGTFSNPINISINDNASGGGVAFSANSQVLYVSSMINVYQFDMNAANIAASIDTVAVWDSTYSPSQPFATTFYLAHLAHDNKIYINTGNSTLAMHVINSPDSLGAACDIQQHGITLPAFNAFTMPNYPNYFLSRDTGSVCDTLTATLNYESTFQNVNVFPNPASRLLYIQWHGTSHLKKAKLLVYNAMGQLIEIPYSVLKYEYFVLNVSNLSPGVYFLELIADKEKVVRRFIKE